MTVLFYKKPPRHRCNSKLCKSRAFIVNRELSQSRYTVDTNRIRLVAAVLSIAVISRSSSRTRREKRDYVIVVVDVLVMLPTDRVLVKRTDTNN